MIYLIPNPISPGKERKKREEGRKKERLFFFYLAQILFYIFRSPANILLYSWCQVFSQWKYYFSFIV